MSFAPDQLEELEIGCEIWRIRGDNWNGTMCRWPNGRGAVMTGSDSNWGDWQEPPRSCEHKGDYLRLDDPGCDWQTIWVDETGIEWFEVKVDEDYDLEKDDSFWWELEELRPALKARFDENSRIMVTALEYAAMQQMSGWGDGLDHAPNPIKLV